MAEIVKTRKREASKNVVYEEDEIENELYGDEYEFVTSSYNRKSPAIKSNSQRKRNRTATTTKDNGKNNNDNAQAVSAKETNHVIKLPRIQQKTQESSKYAVTKPHGHTNKSKSKAPNNNNVPYKTRAQATHSESEVKTSHENGNKHDLESNLENVYQNQNVNETSRDNDTETAGNALLEKADCLSNEKVDIMRYRYFLEFVRVLRTRFIEELEGQRNKVEPLTQIFRSWTMDEHKNKNAAWKVYLKEHAYEFESFVKNEDNILWDYDPHVVYHETDLWEVDQSHLGRFCWAEWKVDFEEDQRFNSAILWLKGQVIGMSSKRGLQIRYMLDGEDEWGLVEEDTSAESTSGMRFKFVERETPLIFAYRSFVWCRSSSPSPNKKNSSKNSNRNKARNRTINKSGSSHGPSPSITAKEKFPDSKQTQQDEQSHLLVEGADNNNNKDIIINNNDKDNNYGTIINKPKGRRERQNDVEKVDLQASDMLRPMKDNDQQLQMLSPTLQNENENLECPDMVGKIDSIGPVDVCRESSDKDSDLKRSMFESNISEKQDDVLKRNMVQHRDLAECTNSEVHFRSENAPYIPKEITVQVTFSGTGRDEKSTFVKSKRLPFPIPDGGQQGKDEKSAERLLDRIAHHLSQFVDEDEKSATTFDTNHKQRGNYTNVNSGDIKRSENGIHDECVDKSVKDDKHDTVPLPSQPEKVLELEADDHDYTNVVPADEQIDNDTLRIDDVVDDAKMMDVADNEHDATKEKDDEHDTVPLPSQPEKVLELEADDHDYANIVPADEQIGSDALRIDDVVDDAKMMDVGDNAKEKEDELQTLPSPFQPETTMLEFEADDHNHTNIVTTDDQIENDILRIVDTVDDAIVMNDNAEQKAVSDGKTEDESDDDDDEDDDEHGKDGCSAFMSLKKLLTNVDPFPK